MAPRWIDHHCHLPDDAPSAVVDEAEAAGVVALIDVGTSVASSRAASRRAAADPRVWATAGVHPHDASEGWDGLEELLGDERVVAVGECGLDYHYLHSPREAQLVAFAAQIELGHRWDLPVVVHSRDAWDDTFAVLRDVGAPRRLVLHCFTGGPTEAERCLELGAHLSFSGIVTFRNAHEVQAAARACPLERLMVETDSPYLAPVPHRGRPNRPAWVAEVGSAVAALRGMDVEELSAATVATTRRVYGLDDAL